ncbi:MAG: hypothetical protein HQ483_10185 [Rhodospirillales bacterium]|nr:hypothetical protein [Rhodospirillales bacterium]
MRVKTFTASTHAAAMEQVRDQLGDYAVIVSSGKTEDGHSVRIVAAVEQTKNDPPIEQEPERHGDLNTEETIRQALTYHGTPQRLIAKLASFAVQSAAPNPTLALAAAIDSLFEFSSLTEQSTTTPIMLVGPPGNGKTIVAAKLCTQAKLAKRRVSAVSCDTRRAGGVEQLKAFTNILGIELITVDKPEILRNHINLDAHDQLQIIDTASTNPYNEAEMDDLILRIKASNAEPILVLAAGCDPLEIADMARFYGDIGVKRFIVTQMDIARRAGGLLAAADSARLAFCDVSISSKVSDQLKPLSPVSLARLLMPYTDDETSNHPSTEAAQ